MGAKTRREGTYVYLWLIHVVVCQKPTHCQAIILQLKIIFNEKKKKRKADIDSNASPEMEAMERE